MQKLTLTLILCLAGCIQVIGQDFLVLSGLGTGKRFKIYEGDEIRFKLRDAPHYNNGIIQDLKNDSIHFADSKVAVADIAVVDIKKYNYHRLNPDIPGNAAVYAGIGYLLVDQFNHTVVKQRDGM